MPVLNIRHFRLAAAAALAAAVSLTALVAVAPAASAAPLSTKSVILEKLAEVVPGGSRGISTFVADESLNRGFVIDRDHEAVIVYDTSGASLKPLTSISAGLATPASLAINPATHQLLVGQIGTGKVAVIDMAPGSVSEGSIVADIGMGTMLPGKIAVDSANNIAYAIDYTLGQIGRIDLRTATATFISTETGIKDLAIDAVRHVAYVSNTGTSGVTSITADGTVKTVVLPEAPRGISPRGMAANDGVLYLSTANAISAYSTSDWTRTAISAPVLNITVSLVPDVTRGLLYVAYTNSSIPTVTVLKTSDLSLDGSLDLGMNILGLTLDTRSSRLFSTENHNDAGTRLGMYSVTDQPKPIVERVGGADRFAVSAAISAKTYAPGSPVAYVASGAVFTDALSASAAAGAQGGGVLLVQKNAIPPVIAAELSRLKPQQIIVLGGTDTIDPSVETALKAYSTTVTRVGGADRYAVSAAVSKGTFGPMRPVAYIASGAVFPDALSGSAGAGRQGGPVLLVTKDGIPDVVQAELKRLAPAKIVVLGGTNTVSDSVVTALNATAPTSRIGGADRFAVSASVSASAFPTETPIAYVASGANFPDALSGGAAAIADGAPVLLVNQDTLPATIDAELDRLHPKRIIVLGGTNSVSDAVAAAIANH